MKYATTLIALYLLTAFNNLNAEGVIEQLNFKKSGKKGETSSKHIRCSCHQIGKTNSVWVIIETDVKWTSSIDVLIKKDDDLITAFSIDGGISFPYNGHAHDTYEFIVNKDYLKHTTIQMSSAKEVKKFKLNLTSAKVHLNTTEVGEDIQLPPQ